MQEREHYERGFVHKYGGTSVVTAEQDRAIITHAYNEFQRVREDGYGVVVTSGIGKRDATPDGRKATDLVIAALNGQDTDHNWEIVVELYRQNCKAHNLDPSILDEVIDSAYGVLTTDPSSRAYNPAVVEGFPEVAKEIVLRNLGREMHPEIFTGVTSRYGTPNCPGFTGMVGKKGYGKKTGVPIDHEASIAQIKQFATKLGGAITIVPGFVGGAERDNLQRQITLERGGSDATATYWGAALDLDEVVIFSDQQGILPIDPSVVDKLAPLSELTYREATVFAGLGAKIIQQVAIKPARERNIPIIVRNSRFPQNGGTLIGAPRSLDNYGVRAIALERGLHCLNVFGMLDEPGHASRVQEIFNDAGINIAREDDGDDFRKYAVQDQDLEKLGGAIRELEKAGYKVSMDPSPIDRIALVGAGMPDYDRIHPEKNARTILFEILANRNVQPISVMETRGAITRGVLVEHDRTQLLLEDLARSFNF